MSAKRKHLTEDEMNRLLKAAKEGRHGKRDYCLLLICYKRGFRVSELIELEISDIDLGSGQIQVRRKKGSLSTQQRLTGDELRAYRDWLRDRMTWQGAGQPFVFLSERGQCFTRQAVNHIVKEAGERAKMGFRVHPHMLRHSCGFALANNGHDTRLIQDALGHKNIAHTVRYTATAAKRFDDLWKR